MSPIDAIDFVVQEQTAHTEVLFIDDARKDLERVTKAVEMNMKKEEELGKELSTFDLMNFAEGGFSHFILVNFFKNLS